MAYRDDISALEARVEALSAEVADRERERDEAARILFEARAREYEQRVAADIAAGGPQRRMRRRLQIIVSTIAVVLAIAGIVMFASHRSAKRDRVEQALRQFDQFADQACACKDMACVQHVADTMTEWSRAHLEDFEPADKLDKDQLDRGTKIAARLGECITHAMGPR
jgi:hypothetical protein